MVERRTAARTSLIGREREIEGLRELLSRVPSQLVTLTGVGGGGKTRLAMAVTAEVQDAFGGAVHWVSLAPVAEPSLIEQAVASALGVIETVGTPLIETITMRLAVGRCLLVLDNCEHLLDACAELVEHLLAACPGLTILATSREPLMVAGEQQWRVPPLPVPDPSDPASLHRLASSPAVRLFVERAQAVVPEFGLTPANADGVAEVCIRLDGIPLALELAAARVRVLTVEQIVERLDDALRLLTGGSRAAPTRQQTLQATLEWSYDLLTEPERAFFRRVAVFAGSFDLAAVEVVCEGVDALDLVTRLADKSLLVVEADGNVARYRLLEPVRQYAVRHLSTNGEIEDAQARHAACYLALAERAAPQLHGPDQMAWMARLRRDQDNLRAALRWADERGAAETVARLVVALVPFWAVHGAMSEGRRWVDVALASSGQRVPAALRVQVLLGAGELAFWQVELEDAIPPLEEALTLAQELGDERAVAWSLTWLGVVRARQAIFVEAEQRLWESLARHHALGDAAGAAWAIYNLSMCAGNQGDLVRAGELLAQSLDRYQAIGDRRFVAISSLMLGSVLRTHGGDRERAVGLLRVGLTGLREVGDRAFMLSGLLTLAWVAAQSGWPAQGARLLGVAESLRETLGATLAPVNRRTHDRAMEIIRTRLSESERAAALAEGRTMTFDQAIEQAMIVGESEPLPSVRAPAPVGPVEVLTRRELEVVPLLAQGATDREIAEALSIAVSTVGVHVHHILGKLGLNSRWQVVDWAVVNGLAPAPSD